MPLAGLLPPPDRLAGSADRLLARLGVTAPSRAVRAALVAVLFVVLALVDVGTNPDISFLAFYFLPMLLAAWYFGRREAVFVAVASVAVWVADDLVARRYDAHVAVSVWNRSVEFVFFVLLAWLAGTLRATLAREMAARAERLERDLEIAREVQGTLLPPSRLEGTSFTVTAVCRQALGVGGDAYDIVPLEGDALSVAVADVSGKGIPAAILMASFLAAFRGLLPLRAHRLDLLASELSNGLSKSLAPRRFVTAFLGVLEDGWLRYVNAGHEPGLLVTPGRSEGAVTRLEPTRPVLGLPGMPASGQKRVPFPEGSVLLLFTDGLTERSNAAGEEFGRSRVARLAAASNGHDPGAIVESLLRAAEAHAAGEAPGDDTTILCVRRRSVGRDLPA
jgi:serine phosphatase RsbU (regulator of sigma subunit)